MKDYRYNSKLGPNERLLTEKAKISRMYDRHRIHLPRQIVQRAQPSPNISNTQYPPMARVKDLCLGINLVRLCAR